MTPTLYHHLVFPLLPENFTYL